MLAGDNQILYQDSQGETTTPAGIAQWKQPKIWVKNLKKKSYEIVQKFVTALISHITIDRIVKSVVPVPYLLKILKAQ